MWIETLRLSDIRSIESAELSLAPGANVILGPNGAGKTSLLEAAFVLSYGRSFRRGGRDALLRRGAASFRVFAQLRHEGGAVARVGIERQGGGWVGRLNDQPLQRLSDLYAECAVCCFEPGSHELIAGPAEERRAYLDWGVFHVEREFLPAWRRYARALKQRNLLLKREASAAELDPWDAELARSGETVTELRRRYMARLEPAFQAVARLFIPELGEARLRFDPGYDEGGGGLEAALAVSRDRDRARQSSTTGPHRADWRPVFEKAPQRHHLSRGQEKLTALAAVLAQARVHATEKGEWPVMALDDLPSELDHAHQIAVLDALLAHPCQLLLTATELSPLLRDRLIDTRTFHVEQGVVRESGA